MHTRTIILFCAVIVGFVSADTGCQTASMCITVRSGLNKVTCGAKGNFAISGSSSSHLQATDFYHSCLGDAGKHCADPANTAGGPAFIDIKHASTSCCSCFLYAKHCHGKPVTVGQKSVANNADPTKNQDQLVMPAAPCTGVEYWDQGSCPKETIWSDAFSLLPGGPEYGMAINPVTRRGQHQMHIHLAKLQAPVVTALSAGYRKFIKGTVHTHFCLDCGGGASLGNTCTAVAKTSCKPGMLEVAIKKNTATASGATPFATVYGSQGNYDTDAVKNKATMVTRLNKHDDPDTWAVVTHTAGPAECFFVHPVSQYC